MRISMKEMKERSTAETYLAPLHILVLNPRLYGYNMINEFTNTSVLLSVSAIFWIAVYRTQYKYHLSP